jgi:hypothetical protein
MNRTRNQYATFLMLAVLVLAPMTLAPSQANAQRRHAHYLVIEDSDAGVTLQGNDQRKTYTVDLPDGADLSATAVLMFMVKSSGGDVEYQVLINSVSLLRTTYSPSPTRGVWEVFNPANVNLRRTGNTIEFRTLSGSGQLTIGDAILLIKREQS